MNAEIISIGTELLLGDILNTNARYLARELAGLGINVFYQTVAGDNAERLESVLKIAFGRSDMVISTGGLGPTADDLTKETAARYFGMETVLHTETLERIKLHFNRQGSEMPENNAKQAQSPEGAIILPNNNGTAPGLIIEKNGSTMIMLPGPPSEMQPMFKESVVPYLSKKTGGVFVSRTLRVVGLGESKMETILKDLIERQTNPSIAPYAGEGECSLRITAAAPDEQAGETLIEPVVREVRSRLGMYVYAESGSLEEHVVTLLKERGLRLAVAESCTGGALSSRLVNVPGVSDVLVEAITTYSNQSKINRLGVNGGTLDNYGAVSAQTAMEMAEGAARTAGAELGISTTGVAGPGGGTDKKPVGLVYLGIYVNGKTGFKELMLNGDRCKIRARAVTEALDFIRREIQAQGS